MKKKFTYSKFKEIYKIRKTLIIIVTPLVVTLLVLGACTPAPSSTRIPEPPTVPPEVILVWKSPPSPQGFPPTISKSVVLQPYGTQGDSLETPTFFLREGQWIDIIAESGDTLIEFGTRTPGNASFEMTYRLSGGGTGSVSWEGMKREYGFDPLSGKWLYEYRTTETDKGTVWSTAVRVFAWTGAGDYYFEFNNSDPRRQVEITYKVYELAITPEWGDTYYSTKLRPWLEAIDRLSLSDEEKKQTYENQWLAQFK